ATTAVDTHTRNLEVSGPLSDGRSAIYGIGGQFGKYISWYDDGPDDCWTNSDDSFTTEKWLCVEAGFDGSEAATGGTKNILRRWIDGGLRAEVLGMGHACCVDGQGCSANMPWVAPAFETLKLGWSTYYGTSPAIEMWIDDVVVDSKPISCPPNVK